MADRAVTTPSPRTARPHQISAVWSLAIRPALTASPIAPGVNACAPVHSALQTQSARRARQKLAAIHSRYRHGPRISGVPATASGKVRTGQALGIPSSGSLAESYDEKTPESKKKCNSNKPHQFRVAAYAKP